MKTEITHPYQHQWDDFCRGMREGGLVNFSEMGTGKTKVSIDLIKYWIITGKAKRALIVCPKSLLLNWAYELKRNGVAPSEYKVVFGMKQKREKHLSEGKVCVIGYESARSTADFIMSHPFDIIILDESHKIKNPSANVTKFFLKLRPTAKYVVIMTGTPVTDQLWDIWSQMHFAKPNQVVEDNYYVFRNRYFLKVNDNLSIWVPKKGSDEKVNKLIMPYITRRTKDDCLDLPPKIYTDLPLEFDGDQKKVYFDMATKLLAEFEDGKYANAEYKLTLSLRLSQITSGHVTTNDGTIKLFNTPKDDAIKDIIENTKEKVIVWVRFRPDISKLTKILAQCNPGVVFGDTKDRQMQVDKFQTDPTCKVFIGQVQTAGVGLNLTAGSTVVYYSQSYSLLDRMQSEDRCHRIGQSNKVQYINLNIVGSVDEVICKCLASKRKRADIVMDIHSHLKEVVNG